MKTLFYPKFALLSIRKNQKIYLPYLLCASLWVSVYYILFALTSSEVLQNMTGGSTLKMILDFASPVIFFFSVLFLLYTNSFVSKWRNKEYALYHILGMNKANLTAVLFWETIFTGGGAMLLGGGVGIALYKLAELCLLNIVQENTDFSLTVSGEALRATVLCYGFIFVLVFFKNIWSIQTKSLIALLKSENTGEVPPKGNWLLGLLGVVLLGVAYTIALTVTDVMSAMTLFFGAVLLVILATYLLFGAGSVLLCTQLQKNKHYYYKAHHFIALSSMRYRMKRNGTGLASICVLCTMVLVMISSTFSLYISCEDTIAARYPREQNAYISLSDLTALEEISLQEIHDFFTQDVASNGGEVTNELYYKIIGSAGRVEDDSLKLTFSTDELSTTVDIFQVFFVSIEDYNRIMGTDETLAPNEVLMYTTRANYDSDTLTIEEGNTTYTIKKQLDTMWEYSRAVATIFPAMYLVVDDISAVANEITVATQSSADASSQSMLLQGYITYSFDTGFSEDGQMSYANLFGDGTFQMDYDAFDVQFPACNGFSLESRAEEQQGMHSLYGGLFFVGVTLSILFASATVLIMYYKQMVEGYEDQKRFVIMKKIGLSSREIQSTVNSQLLTVFALPIGMAGMHLLFAFPILALFLRMFNMGNTWLFALATLCCFLVFTMLYAAVYRITSQLYYKIVNSVET